MESLVGRTLGNYEIIAAVGTGGMASVFKAYQRGLDRYVALKVLPPFYAQQPGFQERFTREAKAIARLNHPNILPVYDYGQSGDYSYLVMRYVEAGSLQIALGKPVSISHAVKLVGQVGMALEAAHRMGIIHRDVKPGNVLVDKEDWALLTDFGLARMLEESVHLTGTGIGIGTPAYMSPEQAQGGPIDQRTDIYSLGVVLFQMLTGDIPYKGDTPLSIVVKRMTEPLPMPRSLNPDLPEALERVVVKALARDPVDRYQSAAELVAQLEAATATGHSAAGLAETVAMADVSEPVPSSGGTETVIAPVAAAGTGAPGASKRAGCPLWAIVIAALLFVLTIVVIVFAASRVLPPLIKTWQTLQAMPPLPGGEPPMGPGDAPVGGPPVVLPPMGEPGDAVAAGPRELTSDLPPERGAISGFVRDDSGRALPGAKVEFLDRRGERTLHTVTAEPDGAFDAALPAGPCLLVFRDHTDRRNLVPQLYDNQNYIRALEAADVLEVTAGGELRGIEMRLQYGFAVTGRLVGPRGDAVGGKAGSLASRTAGVVLSGPLGFVTAPDGRFRVVAPAGQYILSFEGPFVRKELFAPVPVRVEGDVDLGDVVYERRLQPGG